MTKREIMFMKSVFNVVNPLKLSFGECQSYIFFSKREAYLHVLNFIKQKSSLTYIEVEYVISRLYSIPYSKVHSVFLRHFQPIGLHTYETLEPDIRKCKKFYRDFVRALHSYCETEFDTSQFDMAWNEFVILVEKENQKNYEKKLDT